MEQVFEIEYDEMQELLNEVHINDRICAVLKIPAGDYTNEDCVEKTINYVADHPVENGLYGAGCSSNSQKAAEEFHYVKQLYGKENGKQVKQFIIAFDACEEINMLTLPKIATDITNYFYGRFQVYYGIHMLMINGIPCYHMHIYINTINYSTGYKYHSSPAEKKNFICYIEHLPYNIKIIEANSYF